MAKLNDIRALAESHAVKADCGFECLRSTPVGAEPTSTRTSCALYETSGYVAKRLCTGLLTRDTQLCEA